MTNRSPRLGSVKDAARELRCGDKTIRRRLADGTIPHVRVGGVIRIDLDALTAPARPTQPQPDPRVEYADYIAKVVAAAPPLTSDQVAKISTLLGSKAVA